MIFSEHVICLQKNTVAAQLLLTNLGHFVQSTLTFVTSFTVLRRKGGKRNPWVLQIHFINDKAINKYTVNVASWVTDYCCFGWAFTEQELCRHKWNCKCTAWVGAHSANQTRTPHLQVPATLSYPRWGQMPAVCHRRMRREEGERPCLQCCTSKHIHPTAVSYVMNEQLFKAEERHSVDLGAIGSLHSHCFSGRGRGTFLPEARSKGPRRCLQKSETKL